MAQFTGEIKQKSHNGQDHFRCGQQWGVICDGHGDQLGALASRFAGDQMALDIESAIREGQLGAFVEKLSEYGSQQHELLRQCFLSQPATIADENGVPLDRYTRKPIRGGTTCTAVIHLGATNLAAASAASASSSESIDEKQEDEKIVFAWVGDSSGKIFLELEDGQVQVIDGTDDHSPDNVQEFLRLKSLRETGQSVGSLFYNVKVGEPCIPIFDAEGNKIDYFSLYAPVERTTKEYHEINAQLQNDPHNQDLKARLQSALEAYHEANRAYLSSDQHKYHSRLVKSTQKEDGYGCYLVGSAKDRYGKDVQLAMTRSWGDFYSHRVGVIPTLDVKQILVKDLPAARRRIAFVASDGVHDCYTDEELAKLVLSGKSIEELRTEFVTKSRSLFGNQCDDISFLLKEF